MITDDRIGLAGPLTDSQRRSQAGICEHWSCPRCTADLDFLRRKRRPPRIYDERPLRILDLFAGCGGMSAGLAEAARRLGRGIEIRLAVDFRPEMMAAYKTNLPCTDGREADVMTLLPEPVGTAITETERALKTAAGTIDVLLGGPPCQGHSDLNNHTRRRDPKNALYLRMARAVEVFAPKLVVIENVVSVQHDERAVVDVTAEALRRFNYFVAGRVIDLRRVGVPQKRRRHLLIASRLIDLQPAVFLEALATGMPNHPDRTVRWAIGDLLEVNGNSTYDTASKPTERSAQRIDHLFDEDLYDLPNRERPECHQDGDHTYLSMYGRLRWDEAAQTITTGFGSMGQGRYVHPARRRTITPHEAARLQTFPDWYDFGKGATRAALATMIGNAVPPLLMVALGLEVIPRLYSETT